MGQSKDHRPDLPQAKIALATLDPFGVPLASEVLSGEKADDPVYVPLIDRVRQGLLRTGLLYVGDCKNEITLTIVSGSGFVQRHLPPLSALQQQILALCGFSPAVSTQLTDDSSFRLVIEANRESKNSRIIMYCQTGTLAVPVPNGQSLV